MSGIIGSKLNIRGSGPIGKLGTDGQVLTSAGAGKSIAYEDLAGGISWQSVETGSTMTAVAGNGYPIDTSSNTCTITLPASASVGDTLIFSDYARNWATNKIIIDSNGLNYQSRADTFTVEYDTDGLSLAITYMDATQGWIPTTDDDVTDAPSKGNSEGIFGYGSTGSASNLSNLISNAGVVSADVTGVGSARAGLGSCEYGGDKGIFGFGTTYTAVTNLVSNAGVVSTDVTGVGTGRQDLAACSYGGDKGIFGFGDIGAPTYNVSMTNLVSNVGVVASDVTGVGTARFALGACEYGGDKGIFGFGQISTYTDATNLVSNAGVVASDVTGVGTARQMKGGACGYGYDKGIFGFGYSAAGRVSMTNLVSNAGVVATDTTGVGTSREAPGATQYGGDKGIFGFGGDASGVASMSNLVSNAGVVATDTAGVGTARKALTACSFN